MKSFEDTKRSAGPGAWNYSFEPDRFFLRAVKGLENLGVVCPFLGNIYSRLFYDKMLRNEARMSGITPGMKVIHIGCGPLPMTAMFLAGFGARVTAVDMEDDILSQASRVIFRNRLCDRIRFVRDCGTRINFSGYNAIWLSLHVRPMDVIIRRALKFMDQGARVIFRGTRGKLAGFYQNIDHHMLDGLVNWKEIQQPMGKKSIILKKS